MITLTLKQKQDTSIHNIHSSNQDRDICFNKGMVYAVVLASYYGGKGYSTHKTKDTAAKMADKLDKAGYSYRVIDSKGNIYFKNYDNDGLTIDKDYKPLNDFVIA